jgi:hypothetical protein
MFTAPGQRGEWGQPHPKAEHSYQADESSADPAAAVRLPAKADRGQHPTGLRKFADFRNRLVTAYYADLWPQRTVFNSKSPVPTRLTHPYVYVNGSRGPDFEAQSSSMSCTSRTAARPQSCRRATRSQFFQRILPPVATTQSAPPCTAQLC